MGKSRKLDAHYKTAGLILLLFGLVGCSFPRFVILHDPLSPEEHINLGVVYEKQGEMDRALAEYKAASKDAPLADLYMGNIYFHKKDFDRAERYYRRAIEKTGDPRAYNNLAWLYYSNNTELEEGERLARRAVERSPESEDFKDTLNRIVEKRAGQGR